MPFGILSRTCSARLRTAFVLGIATALVPSLGGFARAATPKVPEGFQIRLIAAVPAVKYPCQLATAPDGSLFVGEDPMDQIGPADKPIDKVLLFRPGKEPVVFAENLSAIFGMLWHDGALYVMNMPNLTVLRDTDGDGKADQRTEIFKDMGVAAGFPNMLNDHIVSGIQIGIDNYLYIAVGDKGVPKATGPDGRTAQLKGGGVLRCRLDGTGLEVFSSGTRNHLEPNLDARDNLFTYDNTDDGLGWWTRVTHHVDGGYYGYPYDYHDRTDRTLPSMAEYGGGSPCGGLVYNEDAWPEKYRGRAFWTEWGKRTVRGFRFDPKGSSFQVGDVIDFVEPGEVEDFRPIDLALSHDGKTMYIADWSMGGWGNKKEKLGRVYAVTHKDADTTPRRLRGADTDPADRQIAQLDHPALTERKRAQAALTRLGKPSLAAVTAALADDKTPPLAKRHLVWVVDAIAGGSPEAASPLTAALDSSTPDVRAQAARALGEHPTPKATAALVARLNDAEPSVQLQAIVTLGRIGDPSAIPALTPIVADADVFLAYSARKALERIGDWSTTARGLQSTDAKIRAGILLTMERVYDKGAVSALAEFASSASHDPAERAKGLTFLSSACRKTPPWDGSWWGTQPARNKAPAKTVDWEGTPLVLDTIHRLLDDPAPAVRKAAAEAVADVSDKGAAALLRPRFEKEADPGVRSAFARTLGALGDKDALPALASALRDAHNPDPVRDAALDAVKAIGGDQATKVLLDVLADKSLSVDRQKVVIAALGKFKADAAVSALVQSLGNSTPTVRDAAVGALASVLGSQKGGPSASGVEAIRKRLDDPSAEVRKRAVEAIGTLKDRASIPALIAAADKEDTRFEAVEALAAMPDPAAFQVYLRALGDKSPDLRRHGARAVGQLRDRAIPILEQLAKRNELPAAALPELRTVFNDLEPILKWKVIGPFPIKDATPFPTDRQIDLKASFKGVDEKDASWKPADAADPKGQIDLGRIYGHDDNRAAFGYIEIDSPTDRTAMMAVGSDDTLTVWVDGKQVYDFSDRRGFTAEESKFEVKLKQGKNAILIRCGNRGGPWQFSASVAGAADYAFLKGPSAAAFDPEAYRAEALKGKGSPESGRALFADLKGLACIKCHAVGKEGGAVGPELSSVGAKYPRDEIIASVLFPSAKISSGFESIVLALADGRVLTGVVKNETPEAVEIQDVDAHLIRVEKEEIEDRKRSDVSIMPPGLAEGISPADFADLIAYLETLKQPPAPESAPAPKTSDAKPLGLFEGQADVGRVRHAGAAAFDEKKGSYAISGAGENMWFAADAFHFVSRQAKGDLTLDADVAFEGAGKNPHRKAVLMIRQSLDADSAYADVALHGDGLTSLQFRDGRGANTHEIQAGVKGPERLRIEKRGGVVRMWVGPRGSDLGFSGAAQKIAFTEPFFVGLGVCSHENDVVERAVFTNVAINTDPPQADAKPKLYSALETQSIASTDRRVVYVAPGRFEAPNWLPDDRAILFNGDGRIHRIDVAGGAPSTVDTGFAVRCNNDHGVSPDGRSLAISDQSQGDRKSRIYTLPLAGGAPKLVTPEAPSYWHGWSPDGATLAYCAERGGEFDVYTRPAAGGAETRLTTAKGLDDGPEYAPDGASIYFNSDRTGRMQIWRMKPDGTDQRQITSDEFNNWFPHVSPDGRRLAFLSYDKSVSGHPADKDVAVRLLDLATGTVTVLARVFGGQGTLNVNSWSPDGRNIAFVTYQMIP
ncbi:MAG: HEAT repeat domain-containing protein [Paludisphaera borealis]|uniref:HEAT repeat domain-containing protein n=1 Tax=Paludisphaera borealis TaxID=1387353 RepID=UPI002847A8FF|nr:HEAT repeat domain-containing protein [Paludisphaera borealis]MDR3620866.1 HEAT repeat domain-containing protein [Paludisphaera borealis]